MSMPGTFSFDSEDDFSRPVAKPSFHIPPSPASSVLSRSLSRNLSNSSLHCRKRPRIDASSYFRATLREPRRTDVSATSFSFDAPSPAPLVNTDYRIAGGLDTPTAELVRQEEQAQFDFEQDLRPSRYTYAPHQQAQDYFPHTPASTNLESRKRKIPNSPKSPKSGWGRMVWTFTGGMAGKVINFCWNTAFHGFHAGGGRGYHMEIDTPAVTAHHNTEFRGNEDVFDADYRERGSTPIPGGFPEETFIENYMSRPQVHQQSETPTQHGNTEARSSLKTNWVMVNELYTDMEGSPARKKARPSTASTYTGPNARTSFPARPRIQARSSMSGASYASPRSRGSVTPSQHVLRPQTSDSSHRQHKMARCSIAQPRQSVSSEHSTPKSPDVVKFDKKMRKKDQRQDESLRRLNQQMQDMIKEAQQALGSKVDVVDDEGYAEGTDASSEVSRW